MLSERAVARGARTAEGSLHFSHLRFSLLELEVGTLSALIFKSTSVRFLSCQHLFFLLLFVETALSMLHQLMKHTCRVHLKGRNV